MIMPSLASNSFLILTALVFVAVMLLIESLYLMWNARHGAHARKMRHRLEVLSGARTKVAQTHLLRERVLSDLPAVEKVLARLPRLHGLDRAILQAGLDWTVGKLLLSCAALLVITWQVVRSRFPLLWFVPPMAGLAVGSAPLLYVMWRRSRRLNTIHRQLPDALDLMTRALRAGHAFSSALKMTSEEIAEPIGSEFRIVHDEVNFGVSMDAALTHLSERVPLTDLRYFVVAVLIQRESGGNLTEILSNLSRLIRERLQLHARIRVLSSEGRLSAWILGVMPFALAALMNIFNPKFMSTLWTDPIGIVIVQYTLALMAFGVLLLIKIVKIRV